MPRIPEVSEDAVDPTVRAAFDKQREQFGFVFNTSRIYAHRPSIMHGHSQLSAGIEESGLISPALQALVCTRVATFNGCPF